MKKTHISLMRQPEILKISSSSNSVILNHMGEITTLTPTPVPGQKDQKWTDPILFKDLSVTCEFLHQTFFKGKGDLQDMSCSLHKGEKVVKDKNSS